jgi:hypothetical protein
LTFRIISDIVDARVIGEFLDGDLSMSTTSTSRKPPFFVDKNGRRIWGAKVGDLVYLLNSSGSPIAHVLVQKNPRIARTATPAEVSAHNAAPSGTVTK